MAAGAAGAAGAAAAAAAVVWARVWGAPSPSRGRPSPWVWASCAVWRPSSRPARPEDPLASCRATCPSCRDPMPTSCTAPTPTGMPSPVRPRVPARPTFPPCRSLVSLLSWLLSDGWRFCGLLCCQMRRFCPTTTSPKVVRRLRRGRSGATGDHRTFTRLASIFTAREDDEGFLSCSSVWYGVGKVLLQFKVHQLSKELIPVHKSKFTVLKMNRCQFFRGNTLSASPSPLAC